MSANYERLTPDVARIRLREEGARLLLTIVFTDQGVRRALIADFKATFPGHGDRYWRAGTREWSVPREHRGRLEHWLDTHFQPEAILREP